MSTNVLKKRRVGLNPIPFIERMPFQNKPLSNIPSAHNPVFTWKRKVVCPHCKNNNKCNSLWGLWNHILFTHRDESNNKSIITSLADQVILEMQK